MGERIDQFCENLRVKLTGIDNKMQALKQTIDSRQQTAEQAVRSHLDAVKKRIDQDQSKVTTAQADLKKWVEERKSATKEKIADWKAKGEKLKLQSRADSAERYASAAAVIAMD